MKRTVILAVGKDPAPERAVVASRGREVRIIEEARSRGREGEETRSGITEGAARDGVGEGEGISDILTRY